MSRIINCPACGKQVSENAAACPACAEPIRPERSNTGGINLRDPVHIAGIVLCIVILIIAAAVLHDAVLLR